MSENQPELNAPLDEVVDMLTMFAPQTDRHAIKEKIIKVQKEIIELMPFVAVVAKRYRELNNQDKYKHYLEWIAVLVSYVDSLEQLKSEI